VLAVLTPLVTPVILLLNTTQKRATRTGVSSSYSIRDKALHRNLQREHHEPVLAVLTPLETKHYTENYRERATRTGVSSSYSTRDKTLYRKLQIEQHEPVIAVLTPLDKALHRKLQIEQHEPVLAVLTTLETKHYTENYR
jgi:hypothetical protein